MKGWVMAITVKQQGERAATIRWLLQNLDNFSQVVATKTEREELSVFDKRIESVLLAIAKFRQEIKNLL